MKEAGHVRLVPVPCSVTRAREVVDAWHRHHGSSTSALYACAVATEDGTVRGVALIGRPVARLLDDGWTLEVTRVVTRVATDGTPNACSALYGIARRLASALGYARLVTYTREDEPGSSPRAAGLNDDGPIRARSWDMPGRREAGGDLLAARARAQSSRARAKPKNCASGLNGSSDDSPQRASFSLTRGGESSWGWT